jgi:hypothetical protein
MHQVWLVLEGAYWDMLADCLESGAAMVDDSLVTLGAIEYAAMVMCRTDATHVHHYLTR